jgi:isoquinoline 1-oxidoreductase alpha subunit
VTDIRINGIDRPVAADDDTPLLWVLRDELGLTGTKYGCGIGLCGACTVLIDGQATRSCRTAIRDIGARAVITIEGIGTDTIGARVQAAWLASGVIQCGYCQSGQICAATALLKRHPLPDDRQLEIAMAGIICRCGTYPRIRTAIRQAARP